MTAALIRLFKAEIVKFNRKSNGDGEGSTPPPAQLGIPAPPHSLQKGRETREELPEVLANAEGERRRAIYQLTALPYL